MQKAWMIYQFSFHLAVNFLSTLKFNLFLGFEKLFFNDFVFTRVCFILNTYEIHQVIFIQINRNEFFSCVFLGVFSRRWSQKLSKYGCGLKQTTIMNLINTWTKMKKNDCKFNSRKVEYWNRSIHSIVLTTDSVHTLIWTLDWIGMLKQL